MNILTIESILTADTEVVDVEELATRIDIMHDALTADETVLSADIITTGGSKIHFLLMVSGLEGEDEPSAHARVDALVKHAFDMASIETTQSALTGAAQGAVVKEFALV